MPMMHHVARCLHPETETEFRGTRPPRLQWPRHVTDTGRFDGKPAQGRPRRTWIDEILQWTKLDNYEAIKRTAEDRCKWRACTRECQLSDPEDS